ncbi:MAG: OmpA family protein [Bernardetiaceae bacterium]|nr:OmpA family protein [Bernardetiaceae bacterium]
MACPLVRGQGVAGVWKGKLTQAPGGLLLIYNFEMHLQQEGAKVRGYSVVASPQDPGIKAKIILNGTFQNNQLTFQEERIDYQRTPPPYFWCIKKGLLSLKSDGKVQSLTGKWTAPDCQSGEVKLERPDPANATVVKKAPANQGKNQMPTDKPIAATGPPVDFAAAEKGQSVVLDAVHFEQSLANLLPQAHPQLDVLATYLTRNPQTRIEIAGHTDNVGSAYKNVQLSFQRAERVAQYLVQQGVAPAQLKWHGYGGRLPLAPNDTEPGRQKNRRVEFKILR